MATVAVVVAAVESVVDDCTELFKQSFEVLAGLQKDSNIQRLEMEARELQQCFEEVKGIARTIALT